MVRHKHKGRGYRRRDVSKKGKRERGAPNVTKVLQEFKTGDKVHIVLDSSVPIATPHRRFIGKTGKIVKKQGSCYLVEIKSMNATRQVLLHPAHIKKQGVTKAE